jgi:hypothetical protein
MIKNSVLVWLRVRKLAVIQKEMDEIIDSSAFTVVVKLVGMQEIKSWVSSA